MGSATSFKISKAPTMSVATIELDGQIYERDIPHSDTLDESSDKAIAILALVSDWIVHEKNSGIVDRLFRSANRDVQVDLWLGVVEIIEEVAKS